MTDSMKSYAKTDIVFDVSSHSDRDLTEKFEAHLRVESPEGNCIDLLQQATDLSKQRLKLAMTRGAVWHTRGGHTQRLRRVTRSLNAGDEIHLYYDAKVLGQIPPAPTLIADCGGYSVWDKPCGMRSQGSKWGDHCTVVRWAERNLQPQRSGFTVHRLDRAANGLILIAHSKRMAAALATLFRNRAVEKSYKAIVEGDFSAQPKPMRVTLALDEKEAISEFRFLRTIDAGQRSELDVRIETGRKHQIRRHLAELGYAITGDRLYGSANEGDVDLQLTAYRLAFHCPEKDELVEYRIHRSTLQEQ